MENQAYEPQEPGQDAGGGSPPTQGPGGPGLLPPHQDPYYRPAPPQKSTFLAGLLSGLLPGLGQVYVGYYPLGFVYAAIFAGLIACIASGAAESTMPLFPILLSFFYFYNIMDAVRRAGYYNRIMAGLRPGELPPDAQMPSPLGSVTGGVILIVIGGLLFLDAKFGITLEWLEDWWPLGLVALGIYLLVKGREERRRSS
jgi:hypothetical protein